LLFFTNKVVDFIFPFQGFLQGLCETDMGSSLSTLRLMASQLNATTTIVRRRNLENEKSSVKVLVRKLSENKNIEEIRISVMGSVDAGKSSLIGVLTQGELDNGRGRARLQMFRHYHEIKSGRTSCISHELLGFDEMGNVINYKSNEMMTAEEISELSTKLISFMDLAGHRRYMRTTIQAVSGYVPHFTALVVASGNLNQMTIENLQIIKAFKIPFFVILTKIDLVSPDDTLKQLNQLLNEIDKHKTPLLIGSMNDFRLLDSENKKFIPIFCVSNVTGEGLDLVQKYLFKLTPNINENEQRKLEKEKLEFHIDEIFRVQGVGTIFGGLLVKGTMNEKMKVKCGPGPNGEFYSGVVKSIHRNKFPCKSIKPNQSASVCFSTIDDLPMIFRSGMVLVEDDDEASACVWFQVSLK
jgi:GTPase